MWNQHTTVLRSQKRKTLPVGQTMMKMNLHICVCVCDIKINKTQQDRYVRDRRQVYGFINELKRQRQRPMARSSPLHSACTSSWIATVALTSSHGVPAIPMMHAQATKWIRMMSYVTQETLHCQTGKPLRLRNRTVLVRDEQCL